MPSRKIKTVVCQCSSSEIIETDWLLLVATAIKCLNDHLFFQVLADIAIVGVLIFKSRLFLVCQDLKDMILQTLAILFTPSLQILHIPIYAAEFGD